MHTGYDNFWMYQNSRHEPVLNLPKNDNHSHAVLTDTYKQVLNGGSPNNFNSCIMPQNNVARSHHSDQQRITGSQYVWPSSVYSLPFRSSNANNFHSQESYPNQCGNLSYSSQKYQVQQNCDRRYLKSHNLNFPYVNNNTNSDNNYLPVKIPNNQNSNTSVARIRVKDVFTLNSNSVFGNSLFQTNQREESSSECPLNYAMTGNLISCDSKMPSEFMDYEKINLLESSNLPSHCGHKTAEESPSSDQQEFLQHSGLFYQSSDRSSSESEFQLNGIKEKNLALDNVKTNPSLTLQSKSYADNIEQEENYNDVQQGSKRIKVKPKRNSCKLRSLDNSETRDFGVTGEKCHQTDRPGLSAASDIMNNASTVIRVTHSQTHNQENLSKIEKVNSFNQDTLIGKLRKWRKSGQCFASNSDSPSQNQVNGQELKMIKITIPHTGQSSFLHFKDSSSVEGISNIRSPCRLESKGQLSHTLSTKIAIHKQINTQENEVIAQINQSNSVNSIAALNSSQLVSSNSPVLTQNDQACFTTSVSPLKNLESVNQDLHQEELDGGLNNQENPNVFVNSGGRLENISENNMLKNVDKSKETSTKISNISQETSTRHRITSDSLVIKQETSETENSQKQCSPMQQLCVQTIKLENIAEDSPLHIHNTELPYCENFKLLEKMQQLDANRNKNIDFNDKDKEKLAVSSKDHEPLLEGPRATLEVVSPCALNNTENLIQGIDAPENTTDGKNSTDLARCKSDSTKVEIIQVHASKKNYTSKINRDKLDLLIEFLNKEEDTAKKAGKPEDTDHSLCSEKTDGNSKMKKEIKPSRNRRKLSKTCIVKNKNNSREMISLLSHKIAQVEIFKCSKTSQIVETNNNSNKSDEKDTCAESRLISDKIQETITIRSREDKDFELSEKRTEISNPLQKLQTQKDLLIFNTKDINMSGNKKFQDTSKESSSGKECDIQEEENVINTMRAFQNFKTHFCMSCDLISGVDSFWINVVSGELRCLNCFKKMLLKAEDSIFKLQAELLNSNNDLDNLVQKSKPKQAIESREENKLKSKFENDLKGKNLLLDFTEFHCDHKKVINLKEGIKQDLNGQINETVKNKILNKSDFEQSFISDFRRTEITDSSNSSKRRLESKENNVSLLEKNFEKHDLKVGEPKSKLKEDACRKIKVCEDNKKQEMKELQEKSRRKSFTKEDEVVRMQSPEWRISPISSKKNCSAAETFPLNYSGRSALEGKNTVRKSVSPKCHSLENYKDELSEENSGKESGKKNIYKESHISIENLAIISKELKKHESTDNLEKSNRKGILKQETDSEEFIEKEKKLTKDLQNNIRKRNNSIEEFINQKKQILEERSKKELQLIEGSDKPIIKTCSMGTCAWHKTHNLGNSIQINSKPDSLDKLKVQNSLKETCFDCETKILGVIRSRDTHLAHEFKRKSGCSNNSVEKQKKVEVEQSRKRKNSEDYSSHKIRVVEEPTKKETKPVAHFSERAKAATKEHNGYYESKKVVSEKQNLKNSGEKLRKTSFSKADYSGFGKFLKKEEKQVPDSSDKLNSKGDFALGKTKNSESKHEGMESSELSRRSSKEDRASVIPKEHSKNEIKKIVGSGDKLKSFKVKEVIDPPKAQNTKITKREIKDGTLPPKLKGREKSEEKEKKHNCGIIPRRHNGGSDMNVSEAIKSPKNYKLKEILDAAVKKKHSTRVSKCNKESIKSGGITTNKKEGRNETEINKREKEVFFKHGNLKKDKKELENDAHQRIGQGLTMSSNNQAQKGKSIGCYKRGKEDLCSSEFNQNARENEKMDSATLLAKLIKKTKKLSWSLLTEP